MNKLLPYARPESVRFELAGTESIIRKSHARIDTPEIWKNNEPRPSGPNDLRLGTIDHKLICATCQNNKNSCFGHSGHIELKYPVWNPVAFAEGKKWLKIICFNCSRLVIDPSELAKIKKARLKEAARIALKGTKKVVRSTAMYENKLCFHCGKPHPFMKKHPGEPLGILAEIHEGKGIIIKKPVYPHVVNRVFSAIPQADIELISGKNRAPPSTFTLNAISVPSTIIRPESKKTSSKASTNDHLTSLLQLIIRRNQSMPDIKEDTVIDSKTESAISELNNLVFQYMKASSSVPAVVEYKSIAARLRGKTELIRGNLLGKRIFYMARGTITSDPNMKPSQVGIGRWFATRIQITEVVSYENRERLMTYILNGRKIYPGATRIKRAGRPATYSVELLQNIELYPGDEVWRDVITGDTVHFNRQPTLQSANFTSHEIVVLPDDNLYAIKMNVIVTPLYGADFDGDQMNIVFPTNPAAAVELKILSDVTTMIMSPAKAAPYVGLGEDPLVAIAMTTEDGVGFAKYLAMQLFANTSVLPDFSGENGPISGQDCISELFRNTPINYAKVPTKYRTEYPMLNYKDGDRRVTIEKHKVRGVLDKRSIGKGAKGGVFHEILHNYGPGPAITVLYDLQQFGIDALYYFGFTVSIMDIILPEEASTELDKVNQDILNKSYLITEELLNEEIIPPIGKTVAEFYEEKQINALSTYDEYVRAFMPYIDERNKLFFLYLIGSKGEILNLANIVGPIGQKTINGERYPSKFGYMRTTPYSQRTENDPLAHGFVPRGYKDGVSSLGYLYSSAEARHSIITKALMTSITGAFNRKTVKSLEELVVNYFFQVRKGVETLVQLVCFGDCLDPKYVVAVKFPSVVMSDKDFEAAYKHPKFLGYFEKMAADRKKYRDIFLSMETYNYYKIFSDERFLSVNPGKVLTDTAANYTEYLKEVSESELPAFVAAVDDFCERFPYILINRAQERLRSRVPDYIREATWLHVMAVREALNPRALSKAKITIEMLEMIFAKIRNKHISCLVPPGTPIGVSAAQCFIEPLTQRMLDAHKTIGTKGTSSSITAAGNLLGARSLKDMVNPVLHINLPDSIRHNKTAAQIVADTIEMMKFTRFVSVWQIFVEKYAEPTHPDYVHEREWIAEFARLNPLLTPPGDLLRYCLRFQLSKSALIIKNMEIEYLVMKLREYNPDIYFVYSPEISEEVVVRAYLRSAALKSKSETEKNQLIAAARALLNQTIRGVDGVTNTEVVNRVAHRIDEAGKVSRDVGSWGINTDGTNLADILRYKKIDRYSVTSSSLDEMTRVLGINAATEKQGMMFYDLVPTEDRIYSVISDAVSVTGTLTSMELGGTKARDPTNTLLRAGFNNPLAAFEEAALSGTSSYVGGLTPSLMLGAVPQIGTNYGRYYVNSAKTNEYIKSTDTYVSELY